MFSRELVSRSVATVLALVVGTSAMGCNGYYLYGDTLAGIKRLKLVGTVTENGKPVARKTMTLTSTNYYAGLGSNATLNAGVQTDDKGVFVTDATVVLCAARPEFTEFEKTEIESSTQSGWGAVVVLPFVGLGTDPNTKTRTVVTSTRAIPRSICYGFNPESIGLVESGYLSTLEYEEKHERDDAVLDSYKKFMKEAKSVLRSGVRASITPVELGVIFGEKATNGVIKSAELKAIAKNSPANALASPHNKEIVQASLVQGTLPSLISQPARNAEGVESGDDLYAYGEVYELVVEAQFDLAKPTGEAPGQLALQKLKSFKRQLARPDERVAERPSADKPQSAPSSSRPASAPSASRAI